jgi:hypothetical protein
MDGAVTEKNILSGGMEELCMVREKLLQLEAYKENNEVLTMEETKLEKNIKNKEKAINDEIAGTTRRRKEEIEASYNEQVEKTRNRIKRIRSKKEKSRSIKRSERIEEETAGLREEYQQLQLEIKTELKQNQVPAFCNTRLYYALFIPKGFYDFVIIAITLLLTLLAIPCSVYVLLFQGRGMIFLALVYFVCVLLFGGIYMLVDYNTRGKSPSSISRIRDIRNSIAVNKRKRKQIRKQILKDRDESSYGLEKFNQEIQDLDGEINLILEQRKDALAVFENTTRFVIGEEIKVRNQEELNELKKEYDRIYTEIKKTEGNITVLSMEITRNYEAYLGKELMTVKKLDQLIELMTNNNTPTVSEAVALLDQEKE